MEIKKQHGVDPLVQLGIWTAAGFIKRRRDGDMKNSPIMPGFTIVGHDWELYLGHTDATVDEVVSFINPSIFPLAPFISKGPHLTAKNRSYMDQYLSVEPIRSKESLQYCG